MDNWQANAIIAQHIAGLMDRDEEPKARAPKRRIRLLPRIDVRGWVARMDAAGQHDHDEVAAVSVQDAECA
jgi:hypothetical protein